MTALVQPVGRKSKKQNKIIKRKLFSYAIFGPKVNEVDIGSTLITVQPALKWAHWLLCYPENELSMAHSLTKQMGVYLVRYFLLTKSYCFLLMHLWVKSEIMRQLKNIAFRELAHCQWGFKPDPHLDYSYHRGNPTVIRGHV